MLRSCAEQIAQCAETNMFDGRMYLSTRQQWKKHTFKRKGAVIIYRILNLIVSYSYCIIHNRASSQHIMSIHAIWVHDELRRQDRMLERPRGPGPGGPGGPGAKSRRSLGWLLVTSCHYHVVGPQQFSLSHFGMCACVLWRWTELWFSWLAG